MSKRNDRWRRLEGGPDRGWSWVVAFAACFNSLVLAGIFRTSGVLFVAFIGTLGVTREEAAWPMVVCISVLNLTGPFSGLLAQRYGIRPVVISGAMVGAAGVSACFFTTSLWLITLLFGGVFGVGYGLVSTLMPVIVNVYFLNLRSTANAIANSGSCFGSVILPVLFEYLIDHFGLSGCFLLTGGLVLNVAIAGALMRPPEWMDKPWKRALSNKSLQLIASTSDNHGLGNQGPRSNKDEIQVLPLDPNSNSHQNLHAELLATLNRRKVLQRSDSNTLDESYDTLHIINSFHRNNANKLGVSYDSLDTSVSSFYVSKGDGQNRVQYELNRAQKEFEDSLSDFQSVVHDIVETSKSDEVLSRFDPTEVKTSQLTNSCLARHSFSVSTRKRPPSKFKSPIPNSGPLKKYSLKFTNSSGEEINMSDLSPVRESIKTETVVNLSEAVINIGDIPGEQARLTEYKLGDEKKSPGVIQSFTTVASSPMFYVTAITNVSFYFLFHMFVNIVVDYSLDRGVPDKDTKYILFAFALSDLFGRLCLGWITDKKYLTRSRFVMLEMTAIGLVFFMLPFASDYWSLIVVSCCYGVLLGSTMVVFPILLVEYLGIEIHAVAYGCLCFMNGFASFTRPFLIGYFRDKVGSYENMFFVLGVISVCASACWMLEKCLVPRNPQPLDDLDHQQT